MDRFNQPSSNGLNNLNNNSLIKSTTSRFGDNRGSLLGSLNASRVSGLGLNKSLERMGGNSLN